ncbi:MAG: response regulator [Burkholderiales bacterium]
MIRIWIVDDHAIFREGLKHMFAMCGDMVVVGESAHGGQLLDVLRHGGIDVLLLDMFIPGISGIDLIKSIRTHYPQLSLLVFSMCKEAQIARRVIEAGASGYLTKDNDSEMLMLAIRKVAGGGRFFDPQLAQKVVFDLVSGAQRAPHEGLSNREQRILRLLAQGLSINEIADQFSISNKTVSTHKMRLMQKMQFRNNADLIRYGIEHSLA